MADTLGKLVFIAARADRRGAGVLKKSVLARHKMALAAALAVVGLAISFRDANGGRHPEQRDALAIFRLRRGLFSRRIFIRARTHVALVVDWPVGRVRFLPRARDKSAAF